MAEASNNVSETKRSGQIEQDGNGQKLSFDEIREETLKSDQQVFTKQTKFSAFCDICFTLNYTKVSALYLCYLCEQYLCARCSEMHDRSHSMVEKESKGGERDEQMDRYLDEMRKESESDRMVLLIREDVSLVDRVNFKHKLDKSDNYSISGLCGLDESKWVICDSRNSCIKVFSIGSHILQRYIRFGSDPHGVTAINVDISELNQTKPEKQCLIAVTLPWERRILFINLTQNPAEISKSIETKKHCYDITFSGDQIVTLCSDKYPGDDPWFITVLSTGGVELKTMNIPLDLGFTRLAVCLGRFYLTDWNNHKVLCMNNEGTVVSHNSIERSLPLFPGATSVDPDTGKIYITGGGNHTLYRLDYRLESPESLFKFKPVDTEWLHSLCVYRDRVYVCHGPRGSIDGHIVSVVRVI